MSTGEVPDLATALRQSLEGICPRNWRTRAGSSLLDPNDPHGQPIPTGLDRRWLWRLESMLAVCAPAGELRELASDLHQYLNETCEHHWMFTGADPDPGGIGAHRQCLWCSWTEFGDDPGSHYVTFTGEEWDLECKVETGLHACTPYSYAVRRIIGNGAPVAGRWRIASLDGDAGLPVLERADDQPEAGSA